MQTVAANKEVTIPVEIRFNPISQLPEGDAKGIFKGIEVVERESPKKNLCFIHVKVDGIEDNIRVFCVLKSAKAPKLKGGATLSFKCERNGQWKNATIIL